MWVFQKDHWVFSCVCILRVVMIRNFFVLNVLEMVQCIHFAIGERIFLELCVK